MLKNLCKEISSKFQNMFKKKWFDLPDGRKIDKFYNFNYKAFDLTNDDRISIVDSNFKNCKIESFIDKAKFLGFSSMGEPVVLDSEKYTCEFQLHRINSGSLHGRYTSLEEAISEFKTYLTLYVQELKK